MSTRFYGKNFSITKLTKSAPKISGALFKRMKERALGRNYNLSLVFVTSAHSKKLNRIYRKKNKPANILSFQIERNEGEIFISPAAARVPRAAATNLPHLFIHGLCHLKGLAHGSKMDNEEKKLRQLFKIKS